MPSLPLVRTLLLAAPELHCILLLQPRATDGSEAAEERAFAKKLSRQAREFASLMLATGVHSRFQVLSEFGDA
jgi:hypothetical protein